MGTNKYYAKLPQIIGNNFGQLPPPLGEGGLSYGLTPGVHP